MTDGCAAREGYQTAARDDPDPYRRYLARAALAFSGPECGFDPARDWQAAAREADSLGFRAESELLRRLAAGDPSPAFERVEIVAGFELPPDPQTLILGESSIELRPGARIGVQVDRAVRDWASFQMRWSLDGLVLPAEAALDGSPGLSTPTASPLWSRRRLSARWNWPSAAATPTARLRRPSIWPAKG